MSEQVFGYRLEGWDRGRPIEFDALSDETILVCLQAREPCLEPHLSLVSNGRTPVVGIWVAGVVDLVTGPRLQEAVPTLVPPGCRGVSLDVERVAFCDTTGLTALINLERDLRRGGTALRLRHPSTALSRILQLTDSRARFDILE